MERPQHSQLVDQWRPEDKHRARGEASLRRERGRSPVSPRRERDLNRVKVDTSHHRYAPTLHARPSSRSRGGDREQVRERNYSPAYSRDDDHYRPSHKQELIVKHSTESLKSHSRRPAHLRDQHRGSRSPTRRDFAIRKHAGSRSPQRLSKPSAEPRREQRERAYPPKPDRDVYRSDRHSLHRRSPDNYITSTRRRSRSPVSTSYRPIESRHREISRARDGPAASRRGLSPPESRSHKRSARRDSLSPTHLGRYRTSHPIINDEKHSSRALHRSPSPHFKDRISHRDEPAREARLSSRSPSRRRNKHIKGRESVDRESDMRPTYPGYSTRGGSQRPARPPYDTHGYANAPTYPPPQQMSPHVQSPFYNNSARAAWNSQSPYASHHGSPPHSYPSHSPYPGPGYPPAPSPQYAFPLPPPQPHYASPPPPPPQSYSSQSYHDRGYSNHHSPAPERHHSGSSSRDPSSAQPRGRGHYSNLSWTPATGSRGGIQMPPRTRSARDPQKAESTNDDDDNPFRPAKDLRAEDESAKEAKEKVMAPPSQPTPPKQASQAENKIKFALKSKPAPAPATSTSELSDRMREPASKSSSKQQTTNSSQARKHDERYDRFKDSRTSQRHPESKVRKEKKVVKRIKPRPTLPPEMAASDSVYYRKPGNESVVGSGTYGKVFKAVHVYTGDQVALKKIRMEGERDGFPVTAIREVKLLQSLNHDNVVKLQEVMVEKNDCYMVFEYLSHDLTGLLNHPTFRLEHSHKKHLAKQLFEGLDYLHRRGVLHRDIKAANILISNAGQLKLADFGLARFFAKRRQLDYTNRVITIWYRSPELLLGETQYGPSVDIWSAACVLVEIFTKHAIFPGDGGEINQLDKIYNVLGTPTRSEWPGIVDMAWFELLRPAERKASTFEEKYKERVTPQAFELLKSMFSYEPKCRPTASEVLEHPYFTQEEPMPQQAVELKDLEGDWHEFESKALRKEKERAEREAKRVAKEGEKRKLTSPRSVDRDVKKVKTEEVSVVEAVEVQA